MRLIRSICLLLTVFAASQAQAQDLQADSMFALVGDIQETLLVERAIGRENNKRESRILIRELALEKPAFVGILGDFVGWGASEKHWRHFDSIVKPLRQAGIPRYGLMGNHDYMGSKDRAKSNAHDRFPELRKSHWYEIRHGGLSLVFLDTNREQLTENEWARQREWLQSILPQLDSDRSVRGILFLGHHPARTNSAYVEDERAVNRTLVPLMQSAPKGLAYFAGHAHGFERFDENGFNFIVSGGGGGARHPYLPAPLRRHRDLSSIGLPRPFHYLLLKALPSGVEIQVRGFRKGGSKPREFDRFVLPYRK